MPSIKLTKNRIERLRIPPKGRVYYQDENVPRLNLCVTSNGHRAWYWIGRVKGKPERIKLGEYPGMMPERAAKAATRKQSEIDDGKNPNALRREERASSTLQALFDLFLVQKRNRRGEPLAEKTKLNYRNDFARHLGGRREDTPTSEPEKRSEPTSRLASKKVSAISSDDVSRVVAKIGTHHRYAANRVRALLSSLFAWGLKTGHVTQNPLKGAAIEPYHEDKRERFLLPTEMPRFFAALAAEPDKTAADAFELALWTGARRSNVFSARWIQFNLEEKLWTIPRIKGGGSQTLPLSAQAVALLTRRREAVSETVQFVFPADSRSGHIEDPRKAWRRVCKAARVPGLRLHDLRRSFGSWQASTGASLPIVGATLGHRSAQATAIYARLHLDPLRKSIERASAQMAIAAGIAPTAKVTQIGTRRARGD
jgi:integrase